MVNEYLKTSQKYGRQWDLMPQFVGYLTAVPPHTCIMQTSNDSADDLSVKKYHNWIE